jgi:hypothetical protein
MEKKFAVLFSTHAKVYSIGWGEIIDVGDRCFKVKPKGGRMGVKEQTWTKSFCKIFSESEEEKAKKSFEEGSG